MSGRSRAGGHVANHHPQAVAVPWAGLRCFRRWTLTEPHANLADDRTARQGQAYFSSRGQEGDATQQLKIGLHRTAIDRHQPVAGLDLRKRSGAAAKYLFDDRSPGGALSWALLLVDVDAEPSTLEMAVDQQVRQQVLDHIDRHREANSPTPADDCRVHPHDLAAHVEQRSAGVA